MTYDKYLGFCPISNPNTELFNSGTLAKIPMNYLGYEVLANANIRQYGSIELQELNHEMLVRIYTIRYIADYTILEAIIATIQGYLQRTIQSDQGTNKIQLDDNSLSNLIIKDSSSKALILALIEYLNDYYAAKPEVIQQLNTTTFINDQCLQLQTLLRKIEYLSFCIIVSIQNAIFGYYKISQRYHLQLIEGNVEPVSTGDYIARAFRPFNPNIKFGLNPISFKNSYKKIDTWLSAQLPTMIERTHLPIQQEEVIVLSQLKKIIGQSSKINLSNPFTSELKDGDVEGMVALEVFSLLMLLCWKSGLSWIPIIGDLVPYLNDGPLGRLLGVTVALAATGFLTQNNIIELRFVPQALFATNTTRTISILFLGLMLGGIFAV